MQNAQTLNQKLFSDIKIIAIVTANEINKSRRSKINSPINHDEETNFECEPEVEPDTARTKTTLSSEYAPP